MPGTCSISVRVTANMILAEWWPIRLFSRFASPLSIPPYFAFQR